MSDWDWGGAGGGAMSGAAMGTRISPGWGTAIGAVGGGLLGGLTGGKGGEDAPTPPDFNAAAERQLLSGRINSPFASWKGQNLSFNGGLGTGVQNLMGQIGSQGALPTGQEARDQAIASAYGQATSRLDPQFAQREEALRSQLMNQGLDMSGRAATTELGNLERGRNDAYSQAMANAIGQGTAAGNAIFNQGVTAQNQPYNQLGSLAGLLSANQGREGQYLRAAELGYEGALNKYGASQAGKNSSAGGKASMAGPLASMFGGGGGGSAPQTIDL